MLRVTAFTGGRTVPSARFRIRQYIPNLRRLGVDLHESPAFFGSYPPGIRALRPGWGMLAIAERFGSALCSRNCDVTILQREMLSTFSTVERFTRRPRILDVDDSIWLLRGGAFAASIARLCDIVICGNPEIAAFFQKYAPRVAILPTPVDTERFRPAVRMESDRDGFVICWSGTSGGYKFLYGIEDALATILRRDRRRTLRLISDRPPRFHSLPAEQVQYIRWSPESEVSSIQDAAAGLMPLDDSPWSRGKCSFKLLTYMACAVPFVATPAGMNANVLGAGDAGLPARSSAEWVDAIEFLLRNREAAAAMGAAGRQIVIRDYSVSALTPRFADLIAAAKANSN
jgi:glycosyltransferase involved in cell wall biosynthesis